IHGGLALVIVLAAAALAGCGGKTATKKDVIAQANGICTRTLRDVRSVPPPAGADMASLSAYLKRVVPIVDSEVTRMKALPRPDEDRALLAQSGGGAAKSGQDSRALAAAAGQGDQAAVAAKLNVLAASPAPGLARRYGMAQCATSPATYR